MSAVSASEQVFQSGLVDRLNVIIKHDDNLSELERIALIEKFGETKCAQAYEWVEEQAWKHGYEHQACIALSQIDYQRATPLLRQKIVEADYHLNQTARFPFGPATLGYILEMLYRADINNFTKNYDIIKPIIKPQFVALSLLTIPGEYRTEIARLISPDYNNSCTRPKESLC